MTGVRVCNRIGCEATLAHLRTDAQYCSDACRKADERAGKAGQSPDTPQWLQFLRMLHAAGDRGVHTFEMRRAFIGNPSQRRAELEERGYTLRVGPREKLHVRAVGVRYFLIDEPPAAGPASGQAPPHNPGGAHGRSLLQREARPDADPAADGQLFATGDMEFDAQVLPSHYREEAA